MEQHDSKSPNSTIANVTRRAQIFENCHNIFQEISQQTSHLDIFPDFKFVYESVGSETEVGQPNPFESRQFQYPHSPIEQTKLLNGEVELERKSRKGDDTVTSIEFEPSSSNVYFERIICNTAGVSKFLLNAIISKSKH